MSFELVDYTVYDNGTGKVLYSGTGHNPSALGSSTDIVLIGVKYGSGWYDASNQTFHAIANGPADYYTYDINSHEWIDPRTLDQVKLQQWNVIKNARELAIVSPLSTPYGTFDASTVSQKSITDAILLLQTLEQLGTPSTIDFTLATNETVTLTTAQIVQVGLLLGTRTQQLFAHGRLKRDLLIAATTIADVEQIVW